MFSIYKSKYSSSGSTSGSAKDDCNDIFRYIVELFVMKYQVECDVILKKATLRLLDLIIVLCGFSRNF